MPEALEIRKYPNRRLYDTQDSSYICLPNLRDTVRAGRDVKVIEKKTGRDITVEMLLLLVQQSPHPSLTSELLHRMIRADERQMVDVVAFSNTPAPREFMECDTCRSQPGTPTLCAGCLHNRAVINAHNAGV